MYLVSILVFDFYLAVVFLFVITDDDIESLWTINKEECDMSSVPYHSNNSVMPVRVTIYEAVNILKKQDNEEFTASEIWRYALYGHLTLSIYFQSPVIFRRIKTRKNKIFLMKGKDDPVNRLCYLNSDIIL